MVTLDKTNADNPYLQGAYAPIDREITTDKLEVIGEIPTDFAGVYARNGPNPKYSPHGRHHWFDGDGMIHAVEFANGRATYRNRYIHTTGLARDDSEGRAVWTGLMEPISGNPKGAPYKDTANTDLVVHGGELVALWYICGLPYRVDATTLETRGIRELPDAPHLRVSAHAKVDETTGEMLFFDYGPRAPFMRYGVADKGGKVVHLTDIDLPGPRLPHDMALTENYSILMDLPVYQEPGKGDRWRPSFHRDVPTRFGILPRHGQGSGVRWFDAEPCYIYHTINAWEEGDEIVMVGCRVSEPMPAPDPSNGKWASMMANLKITAGLHRWRFNLETGETREEALDDRNAEFPMINNGYLGRRSRYSYNQALADTPTLLFDGIVKYDTDTGASDYYDYGDGCFGSEAPFAPRDNATSEDDGYLLSFVHNTIDNRSELIIVEAKEVTRGPIARIVMPQRVPLGFHACWAPASQIGA